MHGLYQKCQWSVQAHLPTTFEDPPMTRNGGLHFCWRPLFLLRCLWNKVPSQRRLTAPVRPSPQVSQSWKCISASVKPSQIKYHPCAKRLVIFPLQLWLTGVRGGQVLLVFFEMVLYFTNTGPRQISNSRNKSKWGQPWILLAQTTIWCNRFSSDVVSAWKKLKATLYYYSHARPYQLK